MQKVGKPEKSIYSTEIIAMELDQRLKDVLNTDPQAKKQVDAYSSLNFGGNTLVWGGLISILCIPLVIVATKLESN